MNRRPNGSFRDWMRDEADEAAAVREEFVAIGRDARELARGEVELARAEMREQFQAAVRGAIFGGIALVAAMLALVWVFVLEMLILDEVMPLWAAALITLATLAVLAAVVGLLAYGQFKRVTVVPRKTVNSVKEDIRWLKDQMRSLRTSSASETR